MAISKPALSLTLLAVWANHGDATASSERRSSTQPSPSKTASGPASSPLSLRSLPPEPSRSKGSCISVPRIVSGCLGEWIMPVRSTPAAAARAAPVPEPFDGADQIPWWPSVASITALDWIEAISPVIKSKTTTPRTCWLSITKERGTRSERRGTPLLIACSSRIRVTSLAVLSPQPVRRALLWPGASDA